MKRAKSEQIAKARELLSEGKSPTAVVAATGIGFSTAWKILKALKAENPQLGEKPAPPKIPVEIPESPVTSRVMNAEEIQKYGCPEKPLKKSPKE